MNRVVCLLLVPAILLTQRAGLSHSHGPGQPAGHDLRPHFHTNLTSSPSAGHGHPHPHDEDEALCPGHLLAPPNDHDADAVFIDAVDAVTGRAPAGDGDSRPAPATGGLGVAPAGAADPAGGAAIRPHPPPPPLAPTCPLYLRHLAILI